MDGGYLALLLASDALREDGETEPLDRIRVQKGVGTAQSLVDS